MGVAQSILCATPLSPMNTGLKDVSKSNERKIVKNMKKDITVEFISN